MVWAMLAAANRDPGALREPRPLRHRPRRHRPPGVRRRRALLPRVPPGAARGARGDRLAGSPLRRAAPRVGHRRVGAVAVPRPRHAADFLPSRLTRRRCQARPGAIDRVADDSHEEDHDCGLRNSGRHSALPRRARRFHRARDQAARARERQHPLLRPPPRVGAHRLRARRPAAQGVGGATPRDAPARGPRGALPFQPPKGVRRQGRLAPGHGDHSRALRGQGAGAPQRPAEREFDRRQPADRVDAS